MARAVFGPNEVEYIQDRVILKPPFPDEPPAVFAEELRANEAEPEAFAGPTADELRREAEAFKANWEAEKNEMLQAARAQAEAIVTDARTRAREALTEANAKAAEQKSAAEAEAARLQADGAANAAAFGEKAAQEAEAARKKAQEEGFEAGRQDGFKQGMTEVERLVAKTHTVLERIQDKRDAVLREAEQQIIDMTLLIARKVVKTIGETQRAAVIENIREALAKVKSRGSVTVKINTADMELSSQRLDEFTRLLEGGGPVQLMEDSTIEPGGCIVETDFGAIDARIASQFAELESKIREIAPVKSASR